MSDEAFRDMVAKVRVIGDDILAPTAQPEEEDDRLRDLFAQKRVLAWPYDPNTLLRIWENSSALNQNVESYIVNIESTGWRLESALDFDSQDARERVRESLWMEQNPDALLGLDDDGDLPEPPGDEEVDAAMAKLERRARFEQMCLEVFLHNVNPEGSLTSIRREMRKDLEITGNAFWEVLRDGAGTVARFLSVASNTVRLTAADKVPVEVVDKVPKGLFGWQEVTQHRFFRRFVQTANKRTTWFKEFGDPRVVNRRTGDVFQDMEAFEAWKTKSGSDKDTPASEMIHFQLDRPGDSYGIPRWIGNMLSVLGSRAADEVNYDYFDNKTVPPMALLVSGGRLGEDDISRIENYIRDNVKGRQNFHKILLIEANPDKDAQMVGTAVPPRMEFKPLTDAQHGDALFQRYDERNIDKVSSSFRLPRLLRGDVRDFNRATAMAALRFAEDQIFEPERREFDDWFNRRVLPALDIRMWTFKSLPTRSRDPETISKIVGEQMRAGSMKPNEARELLSPVLGKDLEPSEDAWGNQPMPVTLEELRQGFAPGSSSSMSGSLEPPKDEDETEEEVVPGEEGEETPPTGEEEDGGNPPPTAEAAE